MSDLNFDVTETNPEVLQTMFEQMSKGEESPEPQIEALAVVEPKVESELIKVEGEAANVVEQVPDGVSTKDGKHIIPYATLQAERARASMAEKALTDMQAKLEAMEAQIAQGVKTGESATPLQADEQLSDEDLEGLKEDFPSVYKGIMAMKAQAQLLESKIKPFEEIQQRNAEEAQKSLAEQVQDAIDSTPKLAFIAAQEDKSAFELAKQFDNTLKTLPAWQGKTLAERFEKVIEMVEATNGAINLPQTQNSQNKTAAQIKAEAIAVANAQAKDNKTSIPNSLSDFPVGQHVANDELENVTNLSTLQLAQKMQSMTPDKLEAYLKSL